MGMKSVLWACALTAAGCLTARAGIIYDAGAALKANALSGGYANPYTDSNGGQWAYYLSTAMTNASLVAMSGNVSWKTQAEFKGFNAGGSADSVPLLMVNTAESAIHNDGLFGSGSGIVLQPGEIIGHPGNTGNKFVTLHFTVPRDGWYSTLSTFRDMCSWTNNDVGGAEVGVLIGNVVQAQGIVSIENARSWTGSRWGWVSAHVASYQTPVKWLAAGTAIDFVLGPRDNFSGDSTGISVQVREEEEENTFDASAVFRENLNGAYVNPAPTATNGTWTYLAKQLNTGNLDLLNQQCSIASLGGIRGWHYSSTKVAFPIVALNEAETNLVKDNSFINLDNACVMPGELVMHPCTEHGTNYALVMRFQPPVSGYYSATAVFHDLNVGSMAVTNTEGVDIHAVIGTEEVATGLARCETYEGAPLVTFGPHLAAAGEPIDFIIGPNGDYSADATAFSIIVRRETNSLPVVYDAGTALIGSIRTNSSANPCPGADGFTWTVGAKPSLTGTFTADQTAPNVYSAGKISGWKTTTTKDFFPWIYCNIASETFADSSISYAYAPILPGEIFMHPNDAVSGALNDPTLRLTVPADMRGHFRARVRDLVVGNGGIGAHILTASGMLASITVQTTHGTAAIDEKVIDLEDVWLRQGETIDFCIDPQVHHWCDSTGLGIGFLVETDSVPSVINIALGATAFARPGRAGWSDSTAWNALAVAGADSLASGDLREANGAHRNVRFAMSRAGGSLAGKATGASGVALLDSWAESADTNDTCTFTLTGLKRSAPYTLYLYSHFGAEAGDASFAVGGGAAQSVTGCWFLPSSPVYAVVRATSDSTGTLTGTFVSGSATNGPAAFNGLQVVGEFPKYIAPGTVYTFRGN